MTLSKQFFRFLVIGALAFIVDVGALYFFKSKGFDLYTSRILSFLIAASFSWLGNRSYTFGSREDRLGKIPGEWFRYLLAMLVGGLVNYAVYAFMISQFELFYSQPWLAVGFGTAGGLLVNFLLARKILYINR